MTFEELGEKAARWWISTRGAGGQPTMIEHLRSLGIENPEELEEQEDRAGIGAGIVIGFYLSEHKSTQTTKE